MPGRACNTIMRIETDHPSRQRDGLSISRRLGLKITEANEPGVTGSALILAMRDDGLELRAVAPPMKPGAGVRIEFEWLARRTANRSRNQPLAKAIGRTAQTVLDATAGLGQDAALLAAIGFQVTAIERNAILAAMLESALRDAMRSPRVAAMLADRLRCVHAEARDELPRMAGRFDCVYLDPMFPPKRKTSALAAKEIRIVRSLVGDDDDAGELLAVARQHFKRVVVKRPTRAAPLAKDVNASIGGKLARYDLYLQRQQQGG